MIKFYFAPWSRASGTLWLLEEIGQAYEIEHVRAEGGLPESYRAVQPNKKVPAIDHDGTIVTERAAICMYLSETFPEAGLAPAVGDPARPAFLTWLVYCDAVFDPALAARANGWAYESNNFSFGLFEDMVANVERMLSSRPFAAGERFTAADTQLASGIHFGLNILKAIPDRPVFRDYVQRATNRPAYKRSMDLQATYA
ncbi:glutathione S-transferase family protein [Arvimicrobium flavum]|uniref:glutathione S-transferase family protein n=1 Tax=Arvimicrobium flavum TaxID=3393320 RepID=UPI00237A96A3|nr:glutathione S-transferase family protein [Mesorhizobium shangrilense]